MKTGQAGQLGNFSQEEVIRSDKLIENIESWKGLGRESKGIQKVSRKVFFERHATIINLDSHTYTYIYIYIYNCFPPASLGWVLGASVGLRCRRAGAVALPQGASFWRCLEAQGRLAHACVRVCLFLSGCVSCRY